MNQLATPSKADRLPPHDIEAEQGILGCLMMVPQDCMEECYEAGVKEDWFYDIRHQVLFQAMSDLCRDIRTFDIITLQTALKGKQQLDQVGGLAYISTLPDAVPSAANLSYYADIVREKYKLRKTINLCTAVAGKAYDSTTPDELLSGLMVDLSKIKEGDSLKEAKGIMELVQEATTDMEAMLACSGITGLTTGLADLDKLTGGLHEGEMIIIAARPSAGKSALGMQIAEGLAVDHKTPTAFFSVEMNPRSLVLRTLGSRARVNIRSLVGGSMGANDPMKLTNAAGYIARAPLFIEDSCGWTAQQIRARARRLKANHNIALAVVDYLQLVQPSVRSKSREQDVASISAEMKMMARELNIPVIVLCQMNRNIENSKGRRPMLSDLRESGGIEQDGDVIAFLHPMPQEDGLPSDTVETKLIVVKQRNGPTDDVNLVFLKAFTRFEAAARVDDRDIPPHHTDQ